jgi:DNA-binding protein YbaB
MSEFEPKTCPEAWCLEQMEELQKQLAAALAACKAKDDALKAVITAHGYESGIPLEALAIQPDDTALQAYRNSVIEECAKVD